MGGAGGGQLVEHRAREAIRYAIAHGARILNCSWGGLNVAPFPGMTAALAQPRGRTSARDRRRQRRRRPRRHGALRRIPERRTPIACRTRSPSRTSRTLGRTRPASPTTARSTCRSPRSATPSGAIIPIASPRLCGGSSAARRTVWDVAALALLRLSRCATPHRCRQRDHRRRESQMSRPSRQDRGERPAVRERRARGDGSPLALTEPLERRGAVLSLAGCAR